MSGVRGRFARAFAGATFGLAAMALLGIVLLGGAGAGCAQQKLTPAEKKRSQETTPIAELQKIEVRQYQGKKLDSIGDFVENSIHGPQYVDLANYTLTVSGKVKTPLKLKYGDVLTMKPYSKVVRLNCVEGWSVTILWEGVLLKDLLERAGYDPTGKIVIFKAYDGYSSSLPLSYVLDRNIIMAYKENGIPLPPARGFPFQVVAEDKWGYKWVKWITSIEVSDDIYFHGYWESRGYNNTADLPASLRGK